MGHFPPPESCAMGNATATATRNKNHHNDNWDEVAVLLRRQPKPQQSNRSLLDASSVTSSPSTRQKNTTMNISHCASSSGSSSQSSNGRWCRHRHPSRTKRSSLSSPTTTSFTAHHRQKQQRRRRFHSANNNTKIYHNYGSLCTTAKIVAALFRSLGMLLPMLLLQSSFASAAAFGHSVKLQKSVLATSPIAAAAAASLRSRNVLPFAQRRTATKGAFQFTCPTASGRRTTTRRFLSQQPNDNMNNSREDLVESNKSSSSSSSDDEEEWRAVVAGFQMYKAAYGDLKVPQRFVVPNMPPWPRVAWGLKLGKVVTAIRATGRYVSTTPSNPPNQRSARLQLLDQLGFVWSVRRSSNDIMLDAQEDPTLRVDQIMMGVQWYRKLVLDSSSSTTGGATEIPNNFVVPDSEPWPETIRGLPLGRQLEAIMRSKNSVLRDKIATILEEDSGDSTKGADDNGDEDDYDDETLENSELPVPLTGRIEEDNTATLLTKPASDGPSDASSANDSRFKIVYTALVCYKKLYDDLLVPQPFIVPKSPQWPVDTWGLRLGSRVNAIRSQGTFVNNNDERRKLLDDLGFNWSPPKEGRRGRKPKEGSGSLFDDSSFDDEYSATESSDNAASDVIFDGSFDFGMDFDLPSTGGEKSSPMWNLDGARVPDVLSKSASAAAEQEAAAKEYEYTPERTFAESLALATERAKECGIIEGLSPKSRVIKGKREKDIPWFNDDFGDDFVFEDVVEALTVYASMYGDFSNLTNSDFVVPTPKEITGFLDDDNLEMFDSGASARAAAAIASFEEQGEIDRSQDIIAAEIMRLQREVEPSFESSSRVPVLASDIMEGAWPEHLAGMELGSLVTRIREGSLEVKHLAERKAQLDAIEFDWGDPKYFIDIPFEKAMCAMYAYYLVRGDMFVPEDFLMPDEDPWPQALSDYPLGKAVKRIRELQNFLEAYHTEKVSLLRMIDFIWFADTVALPLDPNETEMTPETLLLGAMGHPDYAKMIDIPMGLPDKIVADGPFVETDDDPKLWWRKWHNWDYVKDYWYQQGRRDNGYVLRAMGYPRMADEHEAKYGPGLLSQIDQVMIALENGSAKTMYSEEKVELLQQLNYFRQEMLGCTDIHPRDRDTLLSDLDTHIMTIIKEEKMDISIADEMETSARQQEMNNGMKNTRSVSSNSSEDDDDEGEEEEDSDSIFEEQEFDVANELGLGGEKW